MRFLLTLHENWSLKMVIVLSRRGVFSLAIQNVHIQSLGLRKLRSVSGGLILLHNNSQLCYTKSLPWNNLLHPTQGPHYIVSHNRDLELCGRWMNIMETVKNQSCILNTIYSFTFQLVWACLFCQGDAKLNNFEMLTQKYEECLSDF